VFLDGDGLQVSFPGRQLIDFVINPYRTAIFRFAVRSQSLVRRVFAVACGPNCAPLTSQQLRVVQRPFEVAGAEQALLAYAARPIVGVQVSDLRRVRAERIPSLVIFGSKDFQFSPGAAALTARRLGAPAPAMVNGAGHLSMWSSPDQVASVLERLLRRVPPR